MRKIIFSIPITLDGFIEGPNRELDWVIADDDLHDFYSNLLEKADLILFGRITYELMLGYWPTAPTDPGITPAMLRYAETVNPMKKIVYSKTLKKVDWNAQLQEAFLPEEILNLKNQPGRDILLGGGATLAGLFIQHGLVDEYQLVVQPVAIGKGKALFRNQDQLKLDYSWSRPFPSGAIALCYHPDGIK